MQRFDTTMKQDSSAAGPRWTYGRRGYALAQSLRQLKRHKFASLITLLVLGITLALPVILLFAGSALQQLGARNLDTESLTVYLHTSVGDLEGAKLAQDWLGKPGIRTTRYIGREEALSLFRENADISEALDALGSNPLPGAIMVFPDTNTLMVGRTEALAQSLKALEPVERVQLDLRWIKRLQSAVSLMKLIGFLLTGFLTLTAFLVIGNTIRLELLRRRSEMEVASLLGASKTFMNRPILYTGAVYGFLGGILACIIALLAFNAIQGPAEELSGLYQSNFQLIMPNSLHILLVLGASLLLGIAGALTSLYRPSQQLTPRR